MLAAHGSRHLQRARPLARGRAVARAPCQNRGGSTYLGDPANGFITQMLPFDGGFEISVKVTGN
jgi:hypothetical protein